MKKTQLIIFILLISILFLPTFVFAQGVGEGGTADVGEGGAADVGEGGPETAHKLPNFLGINDPNILIGRIITFIIGIAGSAALAMFIYGGILWLISGGKTEMIDKGKKAMIYAVIGLVIIFSSYVIVRFLVAAIGAT